MSKKGSKVSRYLKAPVKILIKARDLYIKSMTEYSNQIGYGSVIGCPTGQLNTLTRSRSVYSTRPRSSDDNWKELISAASTSSLGNNMVQLDNLKPQQARQSPKTGNHNVVIVGLMKSSLVSLKKMSSRSRLMFSQEAGAMLLQAQNVP
ncbi:ARM repeat superfamily protein isoform 1 [Hibiscus syriacus]|uniref:ARM repeat superfamily protein isoform 1 n=1 Tax=Hibiscus syriacus TaxID=106335 RepID=A0A6A3APP3_HIBSY|nr:uncharacterized protein LOC120125599 [Hibiscus syriacus]KAE8704852.1 ARM repeat superfamily protein isoform 1 [Hibiscus syriacus]